MHILEKVSRISKIKDDVFPKNSIYDFASGMWHTASGPLAFDPNYEQVTKKNDIETGEDQKGQ